MISKQSTSDIDLEGEVKSNPDLMNHLKEPEAVALVLQIARFSEALRDSYETLESSILVWYLFKLCDVTAKAIKVLPVKNELPEVALARLAMFASARAVLRQGFKVLGIRPLDEM